MEDQPPLPPFDDPRRTELEVQLRLAAIALLEHSQASCFALTVETGDDEPYVLVMGPPEDARRLLEGAFDESPPSPSSARTH